MTSNPLVERLISKDPMIALQARYDAADEIERLGAVVTGLIDGRAAVLAERDRLREEIHKLELEVGELRGFSDWCWKALQSRPAHEPSAGQKP